MIPGFFDDIAYFNSEDEEDLDSSYDEEELTSKRKLKFSRSNEETNDDPKGLNIFSLLNSDCEPLPSPRPERFLSIHEDLIENSVHQELKHLTSTPSGGKVKANIQLRSKSKMDFPEGSFYGFGKHKDGAEIGNEKHDLVTHARSDETSLKMLYRP